MNAVSYYIDFFEDLNFSYSHFLWYTPLSLFIGVSFSAFQVDISISGIWFSVSAHSWLSMYFCKWGAILISIVFIDLCSCCRLIFPGRLPFWKWQLPGCRAMGVTKILAGWVGRAHWQVSFMCMSFYKYIQVRSSKPPETFCWWGKKKGITQEADCSKRLFSDAKLKTRNLKRINNGLMVPLLKLIRNSMFLLWLLIYTVYKCGGGNNECHEAGSHSLGVYPFWGALALMWGDFNSHSP